MSPPSASSRARVGRLSQHFVASEFACPHCGVAVVRQSLVELLERVRLSAGGPLHVVSGYRCPVHNHEVGGATDSQHMYGAAADLVGGVVTKQQAERAMAVGIGTKGAFAVHVDVRDGGRVEWVY